MVRTKSGCRENCPFRIEPALGQLFKDSGEIGSAVGGQQSGHVLKQNNPGVTFVNDSHTLEEQSGSLSVEPGLQSGEGDILTGEASDNGVCSVSVVLLHVIELRYVRPVLPEDRLAELIDLDLGYACQPRSLKPEV